MSTKTNQIKNLLIYRQNGSEKLKGSSSHVTQPMNFALLSSLKNKKGEWEDHLILFFPKQNLVNIGQIILFLSPLEEKLDFI